MKPITFYIPLAAVALMFACNNDASPTDHLPVAASITAGVTTTRAVDNQWNADHIGITVTDAPVSDMETKYKNVHYFTTTVGSSSADFSPAIVEDGILFQNPDETVTFIAYAPYQPSQPGMLPGNDGIISYSIDVNDFTPKALPNIDFLWASATGKSAAPQVNFTFKHAMSRLTFFFSKGKDVEKLEDLRLEVKGLYPSGTFNTLTGHAEADTTTSSITYDIPVPFSTDMRTTLIAFPGQKGKLYLKVVMGEKEYKTEFPMAIAPYSTNSVPLEGGHAYRYDLTLTKDKVSVEQSTITAWEENTAQTVPIYF